jgi:hypothetical protein
MILTEPISYKVKEVIEELKRTDLWKIQAPQWVNEYQEMSIKTEQDFAYWLQFICLPNLLPQSGNRNTGLSKNYIVPQAMKFFSDDVKKGKLLQLLVELDALI